eukprot:scaffold251_cov230-Pinguiococcus_pyrenoidosus.AAC.6
MYRRTAVPSPSTINVAFSSHHHSAAATEALQQFRIPRRHDVQIAHLSRLAYGVVSGFHAQCSGKRSSLRHLLYPEPPSQVRCPGPAPKSCQRRSGAAPPPAAAWALGPTPEVRERVSSLLQHRNEAIRFGYTPNCKMCSFREAWLLKRRKKLRIAVFASRSSAAADFCCAAAQMSPSFCASAGP